MYSRLVRCYADVNIFTVNVNDNIHLLCTLFCCHHGWPRSSLIDRFRNGYKKSEGYRFVLRMYYPQRKYGPRVI